LIVVEVAGQIVVEVAGQIVVEVAGYVCQDGALLTVIISPRHLAHSMDKRTRANDNGD
jgi:hypothetical protein